MQRISQAPSQLPAFDNSIAYLVGTLSVVFIGFAALAVQAGDFSPFVAYDDEVKVEAAQFPSDPKSDMDIFAGACNGKAALASTQVPCRAR